MGPGVAPAMEEELMRTIPYNGNMAGLDSQIQAVLNYSWLYDFGMFFFLLIAAGATAWIFIDSTQKRKADKALAPRIMGLVGVFFVLPAFIFRFTGGADGSSLAVMLNAENPPIVYPKPIMWNVNWLINDYGPKIAWLAFIGVALSVLAAIIYASTVSRSRPSTEFVSALNNQFGDLRQEIQSVKARQASPTSIPTMGSGASAASPSATPQRSAATVIDRPSASSATIIDRPGGGATLRAVSGSMSGRTWSLPTTEAKIGREAGNLVVIDDGKTSREHAKVRFADGVYTLVDMGSSNGTYVNDRQITGQVPLNDGDLIRIGDTTLAFKPAGA